MTDPLAALFTVGLSVRVFPSVDEPQRRRRSDLELAPVEEVEGSLPISSLNSMTTMFGRYR